MMGGTAEAGPGETPWSGHFPSKSRPGQAGHRLQHIATLDSFFSFTDLITIKLALSRENGDFGIRTSSK